MPALAWKAGDRGSIALLSVAISDFAGTLDWGYLGLAAGAALHQKHDRSGLHDLVALVQDFEAQLENAAARRLAGPRLERRDIGADGVAEPDRRPEFPGHAQKAHGRAVDPVHLRHQPDCAREHQGAVRDAPAKDALLRKFLVDVKGIVVADQASEQRHVAFVHRPATRSARAIDFEVFQVETQRISPCSSTDSGTN